MEERLEIRYIPLSDAVLWDRNPKKHDIGALIQAMERYGMQDPPKYENALGAFSYGNGRTTALMQMKRQKMDAPRGVLVDESGEWIIPVAFGVDLESKAVAEAFAIDHNNLTMSGGDFTVFDIANMWDETELVGILEDLADGFEMPVSIDGDDLDGLVAEPIDYSREWEGMPEFTQGNDLPYKTLQLHFISPEDMRKFSVLIGQKITDKTRYIYYPPVEARDSDKYIVDES